MNPLIEDPSGFTKFVLAIGGMVVILLFSSGCSMTKGGMMVGNNEFWETQHDITREINRPGQVEVIEELKLRIVKPKGGRK